MHEIDTTQIVSLFKALFQHRRSDGRLCVGALPSKTDEAKADEFRRQGQGVPRSLRAHWQFFGPGDGASMMKFLRLTGTTRALHWRQARFLPTANSGKMENVIEATHAWLDIDVKYMVEAYTAKRGPIALEALIAEAVATLLNHPAAPTAVVQSGGGVHAYWGYTETALTEGQLKQAEAINLQLVRVFGGDPAAARINSSLRLPGTLNFNYPTPRPCTLVHHNGPLHHPATLLDRLTSAFTAFGPSTLGMTEAESFTKVADAISTKGRKKTPEEWLQIVQGMRVEGTRHRCTLSVAGKLSSLGWDRDRQIATILERGCTLPREQIESLVDYALNNSGRANHGR